MLEEYHRTISDYLSGNTLYVADLLQIVISICDALIAFIESGVLYLETLSIALSLKISLLLPVYDR